MQNILRNNRCKKLLKGKNGILSVGGNSDIVVSMAMVNYHSSSLVFNEGAQIPTHSPMSLQPTWELLGNMYFED